MGGIKRLLEEEAARQGTEDISQPSVFQAAQRRLDVKRRQYFLERLCNLTVEEIGSGHGLPVASILLEMTDQEIMDTFAPILHDLLQEGREINSYFIVPEPVLTKDKIMARAVKKAGTTCHRCECEMDEAIDLEALEQLLSVMDGSPSKEEMRERHQEMLMEERKLEQLEKEGGEEVDEAVTRFLLENPN